MVSQSRAGSEAAKERREEAEEEREIKKQRTFYISAESNLSW